MKNELLEMKKQRVKMLNKMREDASKYNTYMYTCENILYAVPQNYT